MLKKRSRRRFIKCLGASGLATAAVSGTSAYAQEESSGHASRDKPAHERYLNPRKVLLYENTRKEVREWIASGDLKAAIIPTGSTEQHNEHLEMCMDTEAAKFISQQVALKLYPKVIVTTPVPFGISPHWMNRQGTITVRKEIFKGLVYDICCSMKAHGINTMLIVNGHGGNSRALYEMVPEIRSELGITIDGFSYWSSFPRERRNEFTESGIIPGHADEFETSFALAAFPERIRRTTYDGFEPYKWGSNKEDMDRVGYVDAEWDTPEWDKKSFEDSHLATAEKGERVIAHAVDWVSEKMFAMLGDSD